MQRVIVQNRGNFYGDDAPYIEALVNTGWTDQARVAALAVRQAKSVARGAASADDSGGTGRVAVQVPQQVLPAGGVGSGINAGGSVPFDEVQWKQLHPNSKRQPEHPIGG